ncbi:MAG: Ig-like domain-containing protein, partial [Clostridiales bacterium]|nr:Ig-like domain-containing protein [Clostridiales bacterium]
MRKKIRAMVLVLTALFVACAMAACADKGGGTDNPPAKSDYTVSITAVGSTTIKVSKTVTLRTTVVGTNQKDVTWSSLNENIATVSERGVVTGVAAGEATIKATLDIDPNCTATIKITVEPAVPPTSLTISGASDDLTGWVGETEQLSIAVTPTDASEAAEWISSNDAVAEVSDNGLVTFKSKGDVTITATSKADNTKSDSVTYNVRKGVFLTNMGSNVWDYTYQDAADPYIEATGEKFTQKEVLHTAYFAGYRGTKFFVEATFTEWELIANAWAWQGFGLGAGLSDNDVRYFTYSHNSPSDGNNFNKVILRDNPNSWGALTTRSQMWGKRELNSIKLGDAVRIGMLRDGDDYYYFLNDVMYYFDYNTKYHGIDTIPMVAAMDMPVKVSDFRLVTDETEIDEMLASPECNKSFYAGNSKVDYVDDTDFTLKDPNSFAKDHEAHSIGDKAMVMKNFSIEFDVDSLVIGNADKRFKGVTVNLSRYDSADVVETVGIGTTTEIAANGSNIMGRFFTWDFPTGMEGSTIKTWNETTQPVLTDLNAKHHIKITRTVDEDINKAYFRLYVDGVEYAFDIGKKGESATAEVDYIGSYVIWVAGEYSSFHISDFTFDSDADVTAFPNTLTLNAAKNELEINDKLKLTCELTSATSGATIDFVSLDPAVATVSASGEVTAISAGTAVIVAQCTVDGMTIKATKRITVAEPPVVTITNTETELWPSDTLKIEYELSKPSAHKFVFVTSNSSVATVSEDGIVTPIADGTVIITVKDSVNENVKAQITLTVYTTLRVQITNTQTYIETGSTLSVTHRFSFDQDKHTVAYKSSDETVATVSADGVITPVKEGVVTITVTCKEDSGVTATKQFHIVAPLSMEIKNTETEMWLTGKLTLDTQFSYPCDHTVTYSSSDVKIATVNADGVITAVGLGNVTITATCEARDLTDTITLNIKDLLIDDSIIGGGADSYVGEGYPLDYTIDAWDFTHIADKDPSFSTKSDVEFGGYRPVAAFKNIKGKAYYAEAKISITDYVGDNVWAGVSLANLTDTGYKRGLLISASKASRPMVMKNGIEDWAGTSVQGMEQNAKGTQMWNDKWLTSLNNDNIKLGLLRYNDTFYYFVNGVMMFSESWSTMAHDGNNKNLTDID